MKLAVISVFFPTSRQPWAGHSGYQTLLHLAKRCDVQVFYPEIVYPPFLTPRSARGAAIDRNWNPPGIKTHYIPFIAVPGASRVLNGFSIIRRLLPYVRSFQPDAIMSYFVYPSGFASVRIGQALDVPVVIKAIGSDLNRIPDPICGMLTRFALRNADFTATVSANLAQKAIGMGAPLSRTRPILNGCDTELFHPRDRVEACHAVGIDPDRENVVYVGRLDLRKGLLELIEAVAQLHIHRPRLHCYIVGDGPDRPHLATAIEKHGVKSCITFIPSCVTDQVALWMGAANLVTLPSYNEGCPNVVLEALSSGRPVVATYVGGIPELMDEASGMLIAPRDTSALRDALATVLDRTWNAQEISQKHGRGWHDVADETEQIIVDAIRLRRQFRQQASLPALGD